VEVHITFAGGSFGLHSSADRDPTSEAVQIAKALDYKHPIKVQSLREEEFKVGRYPRDGRSTASAPEADAGGRLTAWHQQIVAEPTSVDLPFFRDILFKDNRRPADDRRCGRPAVRDRELPARVDQLRVTDPDHGVAIDRQLPHGVRARESAIDELAIRDRPRPGRPAPRVAGRESADAGAPLELAAETRRLGDRGCPTVAPVDSRARVSSATALRVTEGLA